MESVKVTNTDEIINMLSGFYNSESEVVLTNVSIPTAEQIKVYIAHLNEHQGEFVIRPVDKDHPLSSNEFPVKYRVSNHNKNIIFEMKSRKCYKNLGYIKLPEYIDFINLRENKRFSPTKLVTVGLKNISTVAYPANNETGLPATMQNISENGCLLQIDCPEDQYKEVAITGDQCSFIYPFLREQHIFKGRIVHVNSIKDSKSVLIGIQFEKTISKQFIESIF